MSSRKQVLILSSHAIPHVGGKSTHIETVCSALRQQGHACTLFSPADIPQWVRKGLVSLPAKLLRPISVQLSFFYYIIAQAQLLRFVFRLRYPLSRRNSFDFISCHDALVADAIRNLVPDDHLIITMHTYIGIEFLLDGTGLTKKSRLYAQLVEREQRALRSAQRVIAVDSRIQSHLETALGRSIDVMPNFVETQRYERRPLMSPLPFTPLEDRTYLLCPRRLVEKNGVIHAVRAMSLLPASTTLLLAGDGPEAPRIREEIEAQGLTSRVLMLGSVDSDTLAAVYQACRIVLVPSITVHGLQEATSLSALEAMASRCVVIASRIGGLRELLEDGKSGFLVDEQSPEAIADRAIWVMTHPDQAAEIAEAARERVVERYDADQATRRIFAQ